MRYRKLELLFLAIGIVGVLVSILISLVNGARLFELLGQALFVPVLFFALHYGRSYGYVAAIAAALIYLGAKAGDGGQFDLATVGHQLIIAQAALFGLVGIIGGELALRIKYVIAKLADDELIDSRTNLFSERYIQKLAARLFAAYERHDDPFSLVFIDLDWEVGSPETERQKYVNRIANVIRSNVRIMDEVGYLDDGRFCLVLPHTTRNAAAVVYDRLAKSYFGMSRLSKLPAVMTQSVVSLPGDDAAVRDFVDDSSHSMIIA